MQKCTKCGLPKSLSEFKKDKRKKSGVGTLCKSCASEYSRGWYSENTDKARESMHQWYEKNGETWREKAARWYAENKERARAATRKWRSENIEKDREIKRKWHAANPEKAKAALQKHRALKRGNGGAFTAKEWRALKEFYNYTCLRCGRREPEIKITPDHILPLVMGGRNDIQNIQPLCFSCNCSKQDKYIDYRNGRILQ